MTREEAIEILKTYKEESEEDYWVMRAKALGMAISALSENKGDLISREEARGKLQTVTEWNGEVHRYIDEQSLDSIPSAENKGEWERVSGGSFIDVYRCSKCKHEPPKKPLPDIKTWGWDFTDFCPKCGADMRGDKGV